MTKMFSVTISDEYADKIKKNEISPSDAFKRGVSYILRERDFTDDDSNPTYLREKIYKMSIILEEKIQEYNLLKEQYEKLIKDKKGEC